MAAGFLPSIGESVDVDIIHGNPTPQKLRTETWEVPGIRGYGAQTFNKGDAEFELTTITFCSPNPDVDIPDPHGHITNMCALQGQIVTLTDNFGVAYANILIKEVDTSYAKKACIYLSVGDGVLVPDAVRIQLRLKCVDVSVADS